MQQEYPNAMPPEEWLNYEIGRALDSAEERGITITYPFQLGAVERIYTLAFFEDGSGGDGLWFQLRNGSIFDTLGEELDPKSGSFSRPFSGFDAAKTAEYVMKRLDGVDPAS